MSPSALAAGGPLTHRQLLPAPQAFVPDFLSRALPGNQTAPGRDISVAELRGNVDSRLRRLRERRGAQGHSMASCWPLPDLARLWPDQQPGAGVLEQLLAGLPRMVLPLTACPTAPAQGALAIECRAGDDATCARAAARKSMTAPTRRAIEAERACWPNWRRLPSALRCDPGQVDRT